MEFKYMLVGNEFYGDQDVFEQKKVSQEEEGAKWSCQNYNKVISEDNNASINMTVNSQSGGASITLKTQKDLVTEFMNVLSLAHMCAVEEFTNKEGVKEKFYNGPSPDEVALVEYAADMDFSCINSEKDFIQMTNNNKTTGYEVFRKMDFNSDRKRMSVLLKDPLDNQYKLYIKGADSIIKSRLDMKQFPKEIEEKTEWFLNTASKQGLRTLLLGMRVVSQKELDQFMLDVAEAELDLKRREELLEEVYNKFERGLVLIGGTAVEDRLQDEVPETIKSLQDAGIKIWMLTGDKLETAENIGESCKLLHKENMQKHRLSNLNDVKGFCTDIMVQKNKERMK
jgi:magnesium-transporting ATPase (P-type)